MNDFNHADHDKIKAKLEAQLQAKTGLQSVNYPMAFGSKSASPDVMQAAGSGPPGHGVTTDLRQLALKYTEGTEERDLLFVADQMHEDAILRRENERIVILHQEKRIANLEARIHMAQFALTAQGTNV